MILFASNLPFLSNTYVYSRFFKEGTSDKPLEELPTTASTHFMNEK